MRVWACRTHGSEESLLQSFSQRDLREEPLRDNIRLEYREIVCCSMDLINLVQDRDQWRALENTMLNLQFHKILGNS
jgi:hypothetical protein